MDLLIRSEKPIEEWVAYFSYEVPKISTPGQLVKEISHISSLYREAQENYLEATNIATHHRLRQKDMLNNIYQEVRDRHLAACNGNAQKIKSTVIKKEVEMESAAILHNIELYQYERDFWDDIRRYLVQQMDLLRQISVALGYNIKIRERVPNNL